MERAVMFVKLTSENKVTHAIVKEHYSFEEFTKIRFWVL